MPIEVRELVIKATIVQEGTGGNASTAGSENNAVAPNEEMIHICVERILEILKEKKDR